MKRFFSKLNPSRQSSSDSRPSNRVTPRLEVLEDRLSPSSFHWGYRSMSGDSNPQHSFTGGVVYSNPRHSFTAGSFGITVEHA